MLHVHPGLHAFLIRWTRTTSDTATVTIPEPASRPAAHDPGRGLFCSQHGAPGGGAAGRGPGPGLTRAGTGEGREVLTQTRGLGDVPVATQDRGRGDGSRGPPWGREVLVLWPPRAGQAPGAEAGNQNAREACLRCPRARPVALIEHTSLKRNDLQEHEM